MRLLVHVSLLFLMVGCGTPSFLITPVSNTNQLQEIQVQPGSGWWPKKIAIIEVEGVLMNARTGGFLQPTENPLSRFVQQMEQAAKDPSVKAVVLRVNSPGGTVTASDTMYQTVVQFRRKTGKPVIAATQEMAASGAYYVSCGADKIIAHPTSVIGSIGVIFNTFNLEGTMAKLGVRSEAIKSGPFKDMGSPFNALKPAERAVMQGMVDEYFARFKAVIAENRPIRDEQAMELATDGRIFSGQQAVELGLADAVGQLDDAIDLARDMADAKGAKVVMYKRPYGYSGSIYADASAPRPQANVMTLSFPGSAALLPSGFYYLWEP